MERKPLKSLTHTQSKYKLELINNDVCGPLQVESIGGSRYFATSIDDYSRNVSVYFTKQQDNQMLTSRNRKQATKHARTHARTYARNTNIIIQYINHLKTRISCSVT